MNCCECDGTIPGPPIYKNFDKGYTLLWAFPMCRPCYLKTILEPRWGKDFIMKYSPNWYEKSYPQTLQNCNENNYENACLETRNMR